MTGILQAIKKCVSLIALCILAATAGCGGEDGQVEGPEKVQVYASGRFQKNDDPQKIIWIIGVMSKRVKDGDVLLKTSIEDRPDSGVGKPDEPDRVELFFSGFSDRLAEDLKKSPVTSVTLICDGKQIDISDSIRYYKDVSFVEVKTSINRIEEISKSKKIECQIGKAKFVITDSMKRSMENLIKEINGDRKARRAKAYKAALARAKDSKTAKSKSVP
jgi:hypothetical protein